MTLVEAVLPMLADSGLPAGLWAEAMRTFAHVKSMALHRTLRWDTPHRLWHDAPAPADDLRAFGCHTWVTHPAGSVHRPLSPVTLSPAPHATPSPLLRDFGAPALPPPCATSAPDSPNFINMPSGNLHDPFAAGIASQSAGIASFFLPAQDPANWKQAVVDIDRVSWENGAAEDFCSPIEDYGVFGPVGHLSLPGRARLLGGRFAFRRKLDKQGMVTSFQAHLVAQAFSQRPGVEFNKTLAPVAKFVSIRTIVTLAARHRLLLAQANVDKAYLLGNLAEDLYMKVLEGALDPLLQGKVLKLHKSIYSLKPTSQVCLTKFTPPCAC